MGTIDAGSSQSEDLLSPEDLPRGAWSIPDSEPLGSSDVALPDRSQRWSHRQHLLVRRVSISGRDGVQAKVGLHRLDVAGKGYWSRTETPILLVDYPSDDSDAHDRLDW